MSSATTTQGFELGYRAPLDGLRGLCILAVLIFHSDIPILAGGFLGVDGFFVLSGFLITSILVEEWQTTGRINYRAFYGRRALRLLPALYVVLVFTALSAATFSADMKPYALSEWLGVGSALLYVSNWVAAAGSHWVLVPGNCCAILGRLAPTWSLGVEEQFYLVWPILLRFALARWRTGPALLKFTALLIGLSACEQAVLFVLGVSWPQIYVGSDTRAYSLLVGCFMSMLVFYVAPEIWQRVRSRLTAGMVILLIPLALFLVQGDIEAPFFYLGGFFLVAVAVGLLILHVVTVPAGLVAGVLKFPPLIGLGKISYAVYLWHPLVFSYIYPGKFGLSLLEVNIWRWGITIAIAFFSLRYIEGPALRLKKRLHSPPSAPAATAARSDYPPQVER